MKSFKNFSDLHEKAKKDLYANPDWKGQSGLEALGSVLKNTLTGRGAAGIRDDDRKAREKAAKNYSGQSGLQGVASVLRNTVTGRGAAGIRKDAEDHRRRNDPSYVPKPKKPKKPSGLSKEQQDKLKAAVDKKRRSGEMPDLRGGDGKTRYGDGSPIVKTKKKPPGGDEQPVAPRVKPQKPSAKDDPRNADYIKKRKDLKATAFQNKDDQDKATKSVEKAGMDAWAKANPKLAAAKKKRDAERGTSKSTNPLMKKYMPRIKKREQEAKAKSDPFKNAPPVSQAQKDAAAKLDDATLKRYNMDPKKSRGSSTDTSSKPPAVKPTAKPKASTRIGGGTPGDGYLGNPKYGVKNPMPSIRRGVDSLMGGPRYNPKPTVKVGDKVGYSKGGEVKKKTKKESFLGFADYLAEKKTKIKLNPKKDDLLEGGCGSYSKGGDVKKNHGEDCDCMKCEKKRRKDDLGDEKTVSTEGYAYVSQEEVSEEGYQEGYETETDLTEASFEIGPGHRGAMRGKKIYDKGKGTTNPHEKDAFLKRTGPQLPLAKGKKSLETASYEPEGDQIDEALPGSIEAKKGSTYDSKKDFKQAFKANPGAFKSALPSIGGQKPGMMAYGKPGNYGPGDTRPTRPMPAFQQKQMFKSGIGMKGSGGSGKGFWKATMKANNATIAGNNNANKPKPMQANRTNISTSNAGTSRPGGTSDATAIAQAKLKSKSKTKVSNLGKDGLQRMPESRRLKSFGTVAAMNEEQLNEFLGGIFKAIGGAAKKVAKPKQPQQQQQKQPQQSPLKSVMSGGKDLAPMLGKSSKNTPLSGIAGARTAADSLSKTMAKPASIDDKPIDSTVDKKSTEDLKRKKREGEKLKGLKASMEEAINQVYEGKKKELSIDDQMRISKEYNRMSPEEKKKANKKAVAGIPKGKRKKDTRTDDEKMTDATGPRPGSRYRGD